MKLSRVDVGQIFVNSDTRGLAGKSARSAVHTTLTQVAELVLSTSSTLVLARLLTPDDFGLIAMVTVFISFATMFKDAGLSMATIQKERINESEISSLFWINVGVAFSISIILISVIPLIVSFYDRPEVAKILLILACSFSISGFAVQHEATLKRLMRFDLIGIIKVSSQFLSIVIAIILALNGFKYFALVFQIFALHVFNTILVYIAIPWVPSLTFKYRETRDMIKFGADITGFSFINYFARNGDNILIGKFLGSEALGYYSKAYQLFLAPVSKIRSPITNVAVPVLSRIKNEPDRFKKYCSFVVEILALASFPITIICFLEAEFIINMILGPGWEESIFVFKVLSIFGPLQVILGIRGSILISMGYTRKFFYLGLVYSILTIIAFIIGLKYGINGVAIAYVILQYLLFVPSLFYSFNNTPFTVTAFFNALLPQFTITIFLVGVHYLVNQYITWNNFTSVLTIVFTGLIFLIINYLRRDFRNRALTIIKQKKN